MIELTTTNSGDPVPLRGRGYGSSRIMVTRMELEFPPVLDFGIWEQAGIKIARIADSSAWCLGDWLIYGQDRYVDRYRRVIEVANLDYQTLRNYAWVARRFDLGRRRERLSFQHHAEVAALPAQEQDRWLDLAEALGLSRNELRRRVRAGRELSGDPPAVVRLSSSAARVARWREAAEQASQSFEDWIVETLDDCAAHALSAAAVADFARMVTEP